MYQQLRRLKKLPEPTSSTPTPVIENTLTITSLNETTHTILEPSTPNESRPPNVDIYLDKISNKKRPLRRTKSMDLRLLREEIPQPIIKTE